MSAEGCFEMIATVDISPGAEIFNTYGDLSVSDLLLKYGFVNQESEPYDDVRFDLTDQLVKLAASMYPEREEDMEERLDFLDEQNIMFSTVQSVEPAGPPAPVPRPDFDDGEFVVKADRPVAPALLATLGLLLCTRGSIARVEEMIVGSSSDEDHDDDDDDDHEAKEEKEQAEEAPPPTDDDIESSVTAATVVAFLVLFTAPLCLNGVVWS